MAYIKLTSEQPGIIGLLESFPKSAKPLSELVEHLLRSPDYTLPTWVREAIAGFTSATNNVAFCDHSHTSAGIALALKAGHTVEQSTDELKKYKPLLELASVIAKFKIDSQGHVQAAKAAGFTDEEIHHTILIASAFCMYNRYVDGCGTEYSTDSNDYIETGARLAEHGYLPPVKKEEELEHSNV